MQVSWGVSLALLNGKLCPQVCQGERVQLGWGRRLLEVCVCARRAPARSHGEGLHAGWIPQGGSWGSQRLLGTWRFFSPHGGGEGVATRVWW